MSQQAAMMAVGTREASAKSLLSSSGTSYEQIMIPYSTYPIFALDKIKIVSLTTVS